MILETLGGLSLLGAVVLGIRVFGLSGIGIGFLVGYGLYYGAVWLICRKALSFRLSRTNSVWTSLTMVGALAVQVVSLRAPHFRTLVAAPIALIAIGLSVRVFWMEHRQPTVSPAD
jgi:hypothetical protein